MREQGAEYDVSQAAMVVTEPNGAIRAMVGGMDYGQSQFNRAVVPNRQPGSSFKPFVYATAFEQLGLTPESTMSDRPVCIDGWCPQNYGRNYKGSITLISAFAQSINTVPVTLSIQTGRGPIAEMAHRLGIRNEFEVTRALALGTPSVSVLDMTSAYSAFASGGLRTPAYGITRINTLRGELIYEVDADAPRERVLSEQIAAYLNQMMRAVVTSGTGRRADVPGVPAVGKSGTTSSYRDAWFVGFTGNYVAAVWFGNDDYHATNNLTGGSLPATAWQKFMAYAHTNIDIKPVFGVEFTPPEPEVIVADAEGGTPPAPVIERPPTLTPEAARKLLDLAERLDAAIAALPQGQGAPTEQVATAPTPAAGESL